ncbi:MAG: hypothetical protein P4L85_03335 [Paludisphaera borealis]|uniref:hypothetical protein n=1 Tax=Paludisphaera borealis TaxID=1387353 RepID=UPI00284173BF|nr:hypothetical protein [Paludisphaera borealis]MDR3618358.1 hypothetical protein [Paludisphaera borealis]
MQVRKIRNLFVIGAAMVLAFATTPEARAYSITTDGPATHSASSSWTWSAYGTWTGATPPSGSTGCEIDIYDVTKTTIVKKQMLSSYFINNSSKTMTIIGGYPSGLPAGNLSPGTYYLKATFPAPINGSGGDSGFIRLDLTP